MASKGKDGRDIEAETDEIIKKILEGREDELSAEELLPPEPENDNDGEWDGTEEFYYGD